MHPAAKQRRHVFRLGIGSSGGAERGFKRSATAAGYGGIEGDRLCKISIMDLIVGNVDDIHIHLGSGGVVQIPNVANLIVKFPAYSDVAATIPWAGTSYTGTGPAGLYAWLSPQLNRNCKVIIRPEVV